MKTIEEKQTKIQEKRNYLKELSKPIQILVKEGIYTTVNEGLKESYSAQGHTELNTLKQWNKKGMSVIKGEKALLLWAMPKKMEVVNADTSEIDELDFFPICFVFSNKQVQMDEKGGTK